MIFFATDCELKCKSFDESFLLEPIRAGTIIEVIVESAALRLILEQAVVWVSLPGQAFKYNQTCLESRVSPFIDARTEPRHGSSHDPSSGTPARRGQGQASARTPLGCPEPPEPPDLWSSKLFLWLIQTSRTPLMSRA